MGDVARKRVRPFGALALALLAAAPAWGAAASGGASRRPATNDLAAVRGEINAIEQDLLQSHESQASAAGQLKKIRRLLQLQKKEIELSKSKIEELGGSMDALSAQKKILLEGIVKQKLSLKAKLRELDRLKDVDPLDATWLGGLDAENQKTYFLAKTLKKDLSSVERLKRDVEAALGLELRILEEKNKLDYYVHELQDKMFVLGANEDVQKEILKTNRASRLEALQRIRSLKESEREIERMLAIQHGKSDAAAGPAGSVHPAREGGAMTASRPIDISLAALKGKLPFPAEGHVTSAFGKSFNPKTNLLTFQKGITLGSKPAAEVRAVAAGRVVFSGPLKNYGLIAIVEHPGQYYTLYGQMGSVAVSEKAAVKQGDVLGRTAGEPLYFEIRNRNVAINPLQWLANSSITLSKQ